MGYLPVSRVAELWGLSERSVRNYCAKGRIPGAILVGKSWNIPDTAVKPARANAQMNSVSPLLERLWSEQEGRLKGGIYHKVQVEMTFNSNRIEGSGLSVDQTRLIFETSTIGLSETAVRVDDVIETVNHFRAVDDVIRHALTPLSEAMLKDLHRTLKSGTVDSRRSWFVVGNYKAVPNEVGGEETAAPEDVSACVKDLLDTYEPRRPHSLEEIIDFHVRFERIHPFQDGNGRVGRLIMFKECLANGIVPFIITDAMKAFYYRGLKLWDEEPGFLRDTCLAAQDAFTSALDYFRIAH